MTDASSYSLKTALAGQCVLLTLIGWIIHVLFRGLRNPLNNFSGPEYAKWTNLRLKFAVITGNRMHYIHSLHQKYGSFVRISPTEISVSDPEAFLQIHRLNSGFTKHPWYFALSSFKRAGVFDELNPRAHAIRRRLLARAFTNTYLHQHWEAVVRDKIRLTVRKMTQEFEMRPVVDMMKWWMLMATDISAHLMFGRTLGNIEKGERSDYNRVLESALAGGGIGAELPLVRVIGKRLPFQKCRELFGAESYLLDVATSAVNNARSSSKDNDKNLFARIIAEADSDVEGTLDDLDVRIEASNLIVAGTDTTAITLTYLIWAVLCRPDLHKSLKEELALLPDDFTDGTVENSCPILNAVIDESLRLYGAAPGSLPRVVPENGVIFDSSPTSPDGKKLYCPPGTTVSTQAYTIHRNEEVFPDPFKFDHTRFLDPSQTDPNSTDKPESQTQARPPHPLQSKVFHPFGAGARSCLGIHLARMELRLGAAEFFLQMPHVQLSPDYVVSLTTTTTDLGKMEMENFFLIAPKSHRCDIVLKQT